MEAEDLEHMIDKYIVPLEENITTVFDGDKVTCAEVVEISDNSITEVEDEDEIIDVETISDDSPNLFTCDPHIFESYDRRSLFVNCEDDSSASDDVVVTKNSKKEKEESFDAAFCEEPSFDFSTGIVSIISPKFEVSKLQEVASKIKKVSALLTQLLSSYDDDTQTDEEKQKILSLFRVFSPSILEVHRVLGALQYLHGRYASSSKVLSTFEERLIRDLHLQNVIPKKIDADSPEIDPVPSFLRPVKPLPFLNICEHIGSTAQDSKLSLSIKTLGRYLYLLVTFRRLKGCREYQQVFPQFLECAESYYLIILKILVGFHDSIKVYSAFIRGITGNVVKGYVQHPFTLQDKFGDSFTATLEDINRARDSLSISTIQWLELKSVYPPSFFQTEIQSIGQLIMNLPRPQCEKTDVPRPKPTETTASKPASKTDSSSSSAPNKPVVNSTPKAVKNPEKPKTPAAASPQNPSWIRDLIAKETEATKKKNQRDSGGKQHHSKAANNNNNSSSAGNRGNNKSSAPTASKASASTTRDKDLTHAVTATKNKLSSTSNNNNRRIIITDAHSVNTSNINQAPTEERNDSSSSSTSRVASTSGSRVASTSGSRIASICSSKTNGNNSKSNSRKRRREERHNRHSTGGKSQATSSENNNSSGKSRDNASDRATSSRSNSNNLPNPVPVWERSQATTTVNSNSNLLGDIGTRLGNIASTSTTTNRNISSSYVPPPPPRSMISQQHPGYTLPNNQIPSDRSYPNPLYAGNTVNNNWTYTQNIYPQYLQQQHQLNVYGSNMQFQQQDTRSLQEQLHADACEILGESAYAPRPMYPMSGMGRGQPVNQFNYTNGMNRNQGIGAPSFHGNNYTTEAWRTPPMNTSQQFVNSNFHAFTTQIPQADRATGLHYFDFEK